MTYELKSDDAREEGERKGGAEGCAKQQMAPARKLVEILQLTPNRGMAALKTLRKIEAIY